MHPPNTFRLPPLLALLALLGACSPEEPTLTSAERSQALTFQSSAGIVSMEAEHYTANTPQGAHSWTAVSEAAASSGVALITSPNNGTSVNTGYATATPRLDFSVNFSQTGTYQVWIRGRDSDSVGGNSDSVHVGLDGQAVSTADRISTFTTAFGWSRATMDNANATLQVATAGQHTINVWMREDGFIVDKIVLATSTTFTPTGNGPAETALVAPACGDSACNGTETCSTCSADCGACPTCTDGVQNGSETGTDCGGSCPACPSGGPTTVWLEAEQAVRTGSPGFAVQADTAAASGQFLNPPAGSSANAPGSARASFTFTVGAGAYRVWARVITPTADDDSFWVSIDAGTWIKWNSIPATSTWAWDDVHNSDSGGAVVSYNLTAGTHTLVVANREDGARLDKLYVTANGDVPSGLGGTNGTCSDGIQNQGESGVDCGGPCAACPQCTNGQTQVGTTACGLNGRGSLQQSCVAGQWANTTNCIDPDLCVNGQVQPGTSVCGLNGRGFLRETCILGQWQDSAVCDDLDACVDDTTQPGTTACPGGGTFDQMCLVGQWVDSTTCTVCIDGQMQPGTTPCGLNGRGGRPQLCSGGQWIDTATCLDPDACVDGQTQLGTATCGINGRGLREQSCALGQWVNSSTCVDSDACLDGQTQPGGTPCGLNARGFLDEQCVLGQWAGSSSCVDPDECVDATTGPGTTPCGSGGTLEEVCVAGVWTDGTTCNAPSFLSAVWVEAEAGSRSGSPGFTLQASAAASGGQYLQAPAANSANSPGSGRVTFSVEVAAGSYKLWARVVTPNQDDDSFWVSVDGGTFVKWNSIPATSTWAWDDVHNSDNGSAVMSYTLTEGTHTITIANREDGSQLDKLYLTSLGDVPTGQGGQTGTCSDGAQNQGETGVDCGGPCSPCPACGDGTCNGSESCLSCGTDCGACPLWTSQDVGAVGAAGSMTLTAQGLSVSGSGDDIHSTYGTALDEFHFAYQPVTGDATIVARVLSVQNTNAWAKGGVMFRENLDADSKFALVFSRPDAGVQAQFRAQTAQTGTDSGDPVGAAGAKWVMLERAGNQFSSYYSTDGVNFTAVGNTTTIAMPETIFVGLAVTSHSDGVLCTAEFDQVSLTTASVCGDAVCDASEDCATCASDCGACGVCGDGTCNVGESCTSCASDCGQCPATGLDTRPANPSCVAPPALSSSVALQNVWPSITFTQPMQVVQPPGESSRLIVVERAGRARTVPFSATSSAQATTFLQLSNVVTASNGGFLSMAFHPNWETNRYAYVVYTTNNLMKRLSRFQSTDGGQTLNSSTEQVVLQIQHDHEFNHNGGQIGFGKDGYLYMSSGDDAYLDYTRARNAAQTNNMFGKVLRIDVNGASPYAIPSDNPFANSVGGLPEIFAYGLRNPWRFSFDRLTGELWLADVGEDTWEEVNIIESGQFYGWPYHEGDSCFTGLPADCATPYASPEYRYTSGAASISGGFVYRGSTLPSLYGKYVFGDYVSGQVSVYDSAVGTAQAVPGTSTGAIVGFGEDNTGELYVVRIAAGRIEKIIASAGGGAADFPALLTDTGCFQAGNPTQVVSGVIPFSVAQPFWSDGVSKERYFAIPNGTQVTVGSDGDWVLPPGGVSIKNFRHQGQLFETRFFVRHSDGTYSGYTYEWNAQQTQATLVPPGGVSRSLPGLDWSYPSRGECFACHTQAAGYSLGLETRQLNVDGFYPSTGRTANQLNTLDVIGMLVGNLASFSPYPAVADANVPVVQRAESYLHVNCSSCHRPGGPGGGPMDARFTTPFVNKGICNEPATLGALGLSDPVLVSPGDHMGSVLWLRMSERDAPYAMPPLATTVPDALGAVLLQEWIDGLTGCP